MRATLAARAPELVISALFFVLVAPVIAAGGTGTAGYVDEQLYHLPTTLRLADELPSPDLDAIRTATTPGLHLVAAVFARLVSDDRAAVEAFAAIFSLAMVLAAYRLLRRFVDPWGAFGLTLPLLLSHYVIQSAAWLNTDNAAMLFIVLMLGVALGVAETGRGFVRGGLYLFLATGVRQLAVWTAGPFVFAAAVAGRWVPGLRTGGTGSAEGRADPRPVALAVLAVIPSLALLVYLVARWGQLTPPALAGQSGTSFAAIPFALAVVGLFGPFFALCSARREDLGGGAPLLAAAAGALLALAVPTAYDDSPPHGRRTGGGIWELAKWMPDVADRSLAIAALAALGSALLVVFWRAAARNAMRRPAAVMLVAIASVAIAQAGTVRTYQRYFEPPLIVCVALLAAFAGLDRRRAAPALGALCVLQLAGCAGVIYIDAF